MPVVRLRRAARVLARVMALLTALCSLSASASLVLYEQDDFKGRSTTILTRTPNLGQWLFNDLASSVIVNSGRWQVCEHAEFAGECLVLTPGRYPSLRALGFNDRITSVRPIVAAGTPSAPAPPSSVPAAPTTVIELFEHSGQIGRVLRATAAINNLQREGFNDITSSVVVRAGRWELCAEAEFGGRCVVLGPGTYPDAGQWGMNDTISSLRPTQAPLTLGIMSIGMPAPALGSADDPSGPELTFASNRTARVSFPGHACVVFFGRDGRRLQNLPQCETEQVTLAEDLMNRARAEWGLDRRDLASPWAGWRAQLPGAGAASGAPAAPPPGPGSIQVVIELHRDGEVRFGNGCVVSYNPLGRRKEALPVCLAEQVRRADDEMATYRRENGLN
ncbi:MAG: beta/gamma crystallin family protein [Rubrivivax sp.]|nr:beta/gamma crystallin family protein [Rubrivivax sp.]